jgi:hypothetical protein
MKKKIKQEYSTNKKIIAPSIIENLKPKRDSK